MSDANIVKQLPPQDLLLTRPDERALPTPLDPAGPEARGGQTDPKPGNEASPGIPNRGNRESEDLGRVT